MMARLVVVVVLLFAVALAARLYRSWRARVQDHRPDHPRIPETLLAGAARSQASTGPQVAQ